MFAIFIGLFMWIVIIACVAVVAGRAVKANPKQAMAVGAFLKNMLSKR